VCPQLIRLWGHECTRVFADRLAEEAELAWFDRLLTDSLGRHMDVKWSAVQEQFYEQQAALTTAAGPNGLPTVAPDADADAPAGAAAGQLVGTTATVGDGSAHNALLFTDFAEPSAAQRGYQQVVSDTVLSVVLQHYLREYNSTHYK
jgi:hypothetical protein